MKKADKELTMTEAEIIGHRLCLNPDKVLVTMKANNLEFSQVVKMVTKQGQERFIEMVINQP